MVNEIDSICIENPLAFWAYINNIRPRKIEFPVKVYKDNELVSDPVIVANTWQKDFSHLYNRPINMNDDFDQYFYNDVITQKILWQNEMYQPEYSSNEMINRSLSFHEIEKIPNDILKKDLKYIFFYLICITYFLTMDWHLLYG